jgi:hypothetical protein
LAADAFIVDDRLADTVIHLDGPKLYESMEFPLMLITGLREFRSIKSYLPVMHGRHTYHGAWHSGEIAYEGSPALLAGAYLAALQR